MRKALIVAALAIGLGGCVNGQLVNPFASFTNPVSKDTLAKVESAYGAALSVAVGYRNACANKALPPSCRAIVVQIQNADKYAHAQILVARAFVKNNPTVDASAVLTTAKQAVDAFTSVSESK